MFKKILALVLMLMVLSIKPVDAKEAILSVNQISIDREIVELRSYNIDGYNYFKLRDLARALSSTDACFNVYYNEARDGVLIIRGIRYKRDDGISEFEERPEAQISKQKVYIDDIMIDSQAYLINDNNYFKLRDLGQILDFHVDYDQSKKQIILDTKKPAESASNKSSGKESGKDMITSLEADLYCFNSKNSGSVNLTKGILVSVLNDRISGIKVVEGRTSIPKDGFSIFHRTDNAEADKDIYKKGMPLGILMTYPIELEDIDEDVRASIVVGLSFISDKNNFLQYPVDYGDLNKLIQVQSPTIYQGNSTMIFNEVKKGNYVSDLYWLYADFGDYEGKKEAMIAYATSLLGTPYSELDCSGLVSSSMMIAGFDTPSVLYTWTIDAFGADYFDIVPMSDLKRGDILSRTSDQGGHMMIYLGQGKVIESQPSQGVVIKNVRKDGYRVYRIKDI